MSPLRRSIPFLLLAALVLSACEAAYHPTQVPGSEARMSGQARRYLDSALSLMQNHSLSRREVDWPRFREQIYLRADGAEVPAHTYTAISYALKSLNEHSFFIPPSTGIGGPAQPSLWPDMSARTLNGRFGYLRTQTFNSRDGDAHAQAYHDLIRQADAGAPCGWIVDMRSNPGGNMWPMLAGVGPILGEGSPGSFIDADGVQTPWFYEGGISGVVRNGQRVSAARVARPYRLQRPDPPVAVLTGVNTASAAEAVVIAFRGRPDTRSFGLVTRGVPTANTSYDMPDGAVVVLTTAWEADRNGVIYRTRIEPDETIVGVGSTNLDHDDTVQAALAWLAAHPVCQG